MLFRSPGGSTIHRGVGWVMLHLVARVKWICVHDLHILLRAALIIDAAASTVLSLCVCADDRTVPSVRCCSYHWCSCQHCAVSVCLCRWQNCAKCEVLFDEKLQIHHCRACGRGFCESCSSHRRPVPERNWGMEPVRVCDVCYESPPRRLSGISPLQLFWPKDKDTATVAMEL